MPLKPDVSSPVKTGALPRWLAYGLMFWVAGVLLAEVMLRLLGFVDFPLYEANSQLGYVPAASQKGSFLHRNRWEFNSLHMGAAAFKPNPAQDVLLVGDSIVFGGNGYRQKDRLGPALQAGLQLHDRGVAVWPISAGSWALRNELAWLRLNPQVPAQVKTVMFVLNTGDFGEASSWSCEATHPRKRPALALWFFINKYVHHFDSCGQVPEDLQVPPGEVSAELRSFLAVHGEKAVFVLYPDREEVQRPALSQAKFAAGLALLKSAGARRIFQLSGDARWHVGFYKDDIHPSPEGVRILANILTGWLTSR